MGNEDDRLVNMALFEGLGSLLMEDLAPNSASLLDLIASGLILTRAKQKPHRRKILRGLYRIFKKRKEDIACHYKETLTTYAPDDVANYEYLVASNWAAIKAQVDDAEATMIELISAGWKLTKIVEPKSLSALAAYRMLLAADSPLRIKRRDIWAFRSFEPVAAIGTNSFLASEKF